jgi:hypothetical protein
MPIDVSCVTVSQIFTSEAAAESATNLAIMRLQSGVNGHLAWAAQFLRTACSCLKMEASLQNRRFV